MYQLYIDIYINYVYDVDTVTSYYKGKGEKRMKSYSVCQIAEHKKIYYFIRETESMTIAALPSKYLSHRVRANISPNTIRREAYSLSYYLDYLLEKGQEVTDIYELPYDKQHEFFTDFLMWVKRACHNGKEKKQIPSNGTCNIYLRDVFGFYRFLSIQYEQFGSLKVLSDQTISVVNAVGVKKSVTTQHFRGYLKEEEHHGKSIEQDKILTLLEACANTRDQLLLLLLAETGYRIGELLGIDYTTDIDYKKRLIRVQFREANENGARAKYAEYRSALISPDTFEVLLFYLSEKRELLKKTNYLFVNLSGDTIGKPLNVNAVYAMLRRLEHKTGVQATPHMLRHYFANQRRKSGWDLPLISKALGHKHIETTIKYLDISTDELVDASEDYYKKNSSIFMVDKLL